MRRLPLLTAFAVAATLVGLTLPGRPAEAQGQCYQETGFCIENPLFQDYFRVRGGTRILGYPVSRTFTLEGNQVQFFQRVVLQLSGNTVNRLNVLDQDVMPMTHANGDPTSARLTPFWVGRPRFNLKKAWDEQLNTSCVFLKREVCEHSPFVCCDPPGDLQEPGRLQ